MARYLLMQGDAFKQPLLGNTQVIGNIQGSYRYARLIPIDVVYKAFKSKASQSAVSLFPGMTLTAADVLDRGSSAGARGQ